ncbi:DUF1127 domain-containing protein [Pacificispira sp.]|uniref:DUF1127 domain-containing protein n=1 Tax=Pacificispira sp. TaxID=2888761 RepID=UPI003BABA81E
MTDVTCSQSYTHFANAVERDGLTIGAVLKAWHFRWQSRQRLSRMTDRELDDVGLDRSMVEREIAKPFWRR